VKEACRTERLKRKSQGKETTQRKEKEKERDYQLEKNDRPERKGETEGETSRKVARVRGGVDAKYRRGCQVAETAAAPLSTGTSRFSPVGRGHREGRRGEEECESGAKGPRGAARGSKVASLIVGGRGGDVTLPVTS